MPSKKELKSACSEGLGLAVIRVARSDVTTPLLVDRPPECAAIADVVRLQGPGDEASTLRIRGLAVRCVQMLSKLEQALRTC